MVCVHSDEGMKGAAVHGGAAYAETCRGKRGATWKNYMALAILLSGSILYLKIYVLWQKTGIVCLS